MVASATVLTQHARLRSTPLLVSASRSSTTSRLAPLPRSFSVAASASPRSSSVSTYAYNAALFTRTSVAFPAQSTLLAGKPFSSTSAHRSLSAWSSSEAKFTDASSSPAQLETNGNDGLSAAEELKQSAEATLQDAGHFVSDAATEATSTIQEKAAEATAELTEIFSNVDPTAAATVTEAFGGTMGVKAGELTELGLNHWNSPPGWITNLLEFVGNTTGLPWWGTIAVTTVALRILITPIMIYGQKNAIRLVNIQPEMKRHMDDIKHYRAVGDQMQMQQSITATRKLLRDSKASPFKSIVPTIFQFPLMFSFFLALERIAKAGAYSFAHGGPFWTPDLTIPDPTYILPAVSTLTTLAVTELGFKIGTTANSDPSQTQMMKYVFRGLMPVFAYLATTFPSGVLVYWATTNLYSLLQTAVLQIPAVRKWVKFPKRTRHPKNPYVEEPKSFLEKIRAVRDQLSDSSSGSAVAKPVVSAPSASSTGNAGSRSDALKEILDDKAIYEASSSSKDTETNAASQKHRQRVLKARQRRARH